MTSFIVIDPFKFFRRCYEIIKYNCNTIFSLQVIFENAKSFCPEGKKSGNAENYI